LLQTVSQRHWELVWREILNLYHCLNFELSFLKIAFVSLEWFLINAVQLQLLHSVITHSLMNFRVSVSRQETPPYHNKNTFVQDRQSGGATLQYAVSPTLVRLFLLIIYLILHISSLVMTQFTPMGAIQG